MKKKIMTLLLLLVLGIGSFGYNVVGQATANGGGQVVNDGQITFYDESTTPSTSSSISTSSSSSGVLPDTQGGGKLPQTGETIRNFSLLGGALLLAVLLFLLYRRKKEKEGGA
ncbi:LPXTG cell wall anchor domain-containing protein [Enterococcus sp. LJL120]